ncbi:hypothetical protein FIBSPDRAFT_245529 [Athelia psychrophila]|uniref:Uncharacterized protein n=1 Tax=Athelia psychrophila TaxID=1759441 RepID=A0A166RTF2_9AGAM|nr:hypothetical protein FIBSPDRAFT_245529 [Fibularhizoctonia sp. CBS 109695]
MCVRVFPRQQPLARTPDPPNHSPTPALPRNVHGVYPAALDVLGTCGERRGRACSRFCPGATPGLPPTHLLTRALPRFRAFPKRAWGLPHRVGPPAHTISQQAVRARTYMCPGAPSPTPASPHPATSHPPRVLQTCGGDILMTSRCRARRGIASDSARMCPRAAAPPVLPPTQLGIQPPPNPPALYRHAEGLPRRSHGAMEHPAAAHECISSAPCWAAHPRAPTNPTRYPATAQPSCAVQTRGGAASTFLRSHGTPGGCARVRIECGACWVAHPLTPTNPTQHPATVQSSRAIQTRGGATTFSRSYGTPGACMRARFECGALGGPSPCSYQANSSRRPAFPVLYQCAGGVCKGGYLPVLAAPQAAGGCLMAVCARCGAVVSLNRCRMCKIYM